MPDSLRRSAPKIHRKFDTCLTALKGHDKTLVRNFERSVFAAATANIGPQVVTLPHRDFNNYAGGLCAITAIGHFDHTEGGHVLIWPLRLAIELPAGATILLPSALFMHSNIPIRANETRRSFTQYSAGGLFRYVDHGFRTLTRFNLDPAVTFADRARMAAMDASRVQDMLADMPVIDTF